MRRWKWRVGVGLIVALLLPPLFGYLHNESVIDDARGQLHMAVVRAGRPLNAATQVEASPDGCQGVVAISFATKRRPEALNLSFRQPALSRGVAWNEGDRAVVECPIGQPASTIEAPVQRLLDDWLALMPKDERRMVVFERITVPNRFDPRCW